MIELYKAGTSHIVNGVTCQKQIVNEFGFEHLLEEGWFFTPEECYPKVADKVKDAKTSELAASKVTDSKLKVSKSALNTSNLGKTTAKSSASEVKK